MAQRFICCDSKFVSWSCLQVFVFNPFEISPLDQYLRGESALPSPCPFPCFSLAFLKANEFSQEEVCSGTNSCHERSMGIKNNISFGFRNGLIKTDPNRWICGYCSLEPTFEVPTGYLRAYAWQPSASRETAVGSMLRSYWGYVGAFWNL